MGLADMLQYPRIQVVKKKIGGHPIFQDPRRSFNNRNEDLLSVLQIQTKTEVVDEGQNYPFT
jgi:cell fate (sporulation/competence/biofilm development) regulator YmcA (YheA/YmcA/DUF963 family)